MSKTKSLTQPQRLRMDVTIFPMEKGGVFSFRVDRKITALRVLLKERFNEEGEKLLRDWLLGEAHQQEEVSLAKSWGGSRGA